VTLDELPVDVVVVGEDDHDVRIGQHLGRAVDQLDALRHVGRRDLRVDRP
jgi:hypothetical protein